MPIRELPARPNLEHLKNQAAALLRQCLAADIDSAERFVAFGVTGTPKLADALHVIAREYGFDTWALLKAHVETGLVEAGSLVEHESEEPAEALAAAIKANNAATVRDVLARHPVLRERIDEPLAGLSFDAPAIVGAAYRENRAMVEALLDAGADINARTRWWAGGFGVLDSGSAEFAEYLIGRGAVVDIHAAARLGKIDRVRELLRVEPQLVHELGGDGQRPLHFAATVEIAALLLDHGAEINARDVDHESTAAQYMVSIKPERYEVARFLIVRGAETDLLMAAALGDLALVESIVNDDPETIRITVTERYFPKRDARAGGVIYIYGFGWTKSAHMLAHQFGHAEVFAFLMQRSPAWLRLINAAEIGDDAYVARLLAAHPALFEKLTENAAKRIIGVATRNNTHAMHLLLAAGWPAGAAMDTGQTALHFAAFNGNVAMVRDLVAHGAAVNVFESEHGGSPLAWALYGSLHHPGHHSKNDRAGADYAAVTRVLLEAGAEVPKPERPLEAAEDVMAVLARWAADEGTAAIG